MSDFRTDEQKAADEALTAAIEGVALAYGGDAREHPLLTDYVVICVQRGWADDGEPITAVGMFPRDGDVPIHTQLGLVEYMAARMRKRITAGEEI